MGFNSGFKGLKKVKYMSAIVELQWLRPYILT